MATESTESTEKNFPLIHLYAFFKVDPDTRCIELFDHS